MEKHKGGRGEGREEGSKDVEKTREERKIEE